jgi:3-hydroxy-9,10-secoandrosta-1,3,5(10)-triene-9,17-dione monooxygenase reductase component
MEAQRNVRAAERTAALETELKSAMRCLAGGVCVITAGEGEERTGMTATSAISLSVSPATMMVCVNLSSSSWPVIEKYRHFCVNVLGDHQEAVAERFAGRDGCSGKDRYHGAQWDKLHSGAAVLVDALANVDCVLDEVIVRHTHAILLGHVCATRLRDDGRPLAYWRGAFERLGIQ